MAPRRSVKISSLGKKVSAVPDKATRRKNTPPLKVPSVITISIPVNKSSLDVPDSVRKIDFNTKIALADEVARSQLIKEPIAVQINPPVLKNKKSRPKLEETQLFNLSTIKTEPEEETKSTATTVKKSNKKTPGKIQPATKVVTRKRVADATIQKPAVKRQKKIATQAANKHDPAENTPEQQNVSETNTPEPENETKTNTIEKKLPLIGDVKNRRSPRKVSSKEVKLPPNEESAEQKVQSKDDSLTKSCISNKSDLTNSLTSPSELSTHNLRKRLRRGKQACDMSLEKPLQSIPEISCLKSPQNLKSPKPEAANNKSGTPQSLAITSKKSNEGNEVQRLKTLRVRPSKPLGIKHNKKTEENISKGDNTAPVNSRQNSISSISNLSWTRDISSSSTTTCVTVSSKDFVCIDKKIPLVKLTNVDSEIHKYKSKYVPNADNADEDSSSSSSDDSSSSDSESSADSDSRISPSGCTSVKLNSLHLSSPSRNSVVESKVEEHNPNKKDYGKAAEKLMQALNKIDMEFINWIHDSDFATSDLSKIKEKLFTILNNEFCALRHCRYLQEISNPERTKDPYLNLTNRPEVVENNKERKKLQTKTIESNATELNKTERNHDEPKTVVFKLVNNNTAEGDVVKGNNTKCDAVAKKLFKINQPCENTRWLDKDSPKRSDRNVTSVKARVETDQITSNIDESYPEEAFIKPSTSGCGVSSKVRRVSEFNDSASENEDFTADAYANKLTQSAHDDDDALSLFAESITGIESSKMNASIMSTPAEKQIEEYIPKPIQNHLISPPNYSYRPTKISDHAKNVIVKTVCEKQNADSTSIYKESNDLPSEYKESESLTDSVESNQEVIPKSSAIQVNSPYNVNSPCLIANLYTLKPKKHNVIFRGYCFFNLIHRCSSSLYGKPCRYSHDIPDEKVVSKKLSILSNEILLKEYMLIRKNQHIMRRFGMCVLFECVKRKLTRVVVEIAYDFLMKGVKGLQIDETLKVTAVEVALLYLNEIDLSVCEDILKLRVGDSLLCEVFMQIMTSTQNFSRFKPVFLSLTYFMVNNDRTFGLEVAEQILERVCILPFDETVVRALIQIMRLTKPEIFLNSMIVHFENLISPRQDIFDEYALVKGEINFEKSVSKVKEQRPVSINQPVMPQSVDHPLLLLPVAQPQKIQAVDQPLNVRPEMRECVPLPPSPDTTHLDNMNKMTEDHVTPKITRTILGFRSAPTSQTAVISPSSSNEEKTLSHNKWKNRSILQKIAKNNFFSPRQTSPFMRFSGMPGRHIRKRQFNHRQVTLGRSPIAYPPPGQDF
ncbi:unnamed protein product [Arctia plantaginis]|uniref:Uncharacterized protein n=1 Tax=Arctia plantaginis TaxID=874455 RepID=A0A8S0YM11_ARCPL|nr:unnamed protein product [Arctia plantaginis]